MRKGWLTMLDKAYGLLPVKAQGGLASLTAVGTGPRPLPGSSRLRQRLARYAPSVYSGHQQPVANSPPAASQQAAAFSTSSTAAAQFSPTALQDAAVAHSVNVNGNHWQQEATQARAAEAAVSNGSGSSSSSSVSVVPPQPQQQHHSSPISPNSKPRPRPRSPTLNPRAAPTANTLLLEKAAEWPLEELKARLSAAKDPQRSYTGFPQQAYQLGRSSDLQQQQQRQSLTPSSHAPQWQPPQQQLRPQGVGHSGPHHSNTWQSSQRQQQQLGFPGSFCSNGSYSNSQQLQPQGQQAPPPWLHGGHAAWDQQQQQQQQWVASPPTPQQQLQVVATGQPSGQPMIHTGESSQQQQQQQQQQGEDMQAAVASSPPSFNPDDVVIDRRGNRYLLQNRSQMLTQVPEDVLVVDTPDTAAAVVSYIQQLVQQGANGGRGGISSDDLYFACDTEVAGIEVKTESPVGHGVVICFSIYAGPMFDFGAAIQRGSGQPVVAAAAAAVEPAQQQQQHKKKSRIWVDLAAGWYQKAEIELQQQLAAAAAEAAAAEQAALLRQSTAASSSSRRRSRSPATRAGAAATDAAAAAGESASPAADSAMEEEVSAFGRSPRRRSALAAAEVAKEEAKEEATFNRQQQQQEEQQSTEQAANAADDNVLTAGLRQGEAGIGRQDESPGSELTDEADAGSMRRRRRHKTKATAVPATTAARRRRSSSSSSSSVGTAADGNGAAAAAAVESVSSNGNGLSVVDSLEAASQQEQLAEDVSAADSSSSTSSMPDRAAAIVAIAAVRNLEQQQHRLQLQQQWDLSVDAGSSSSSSSDGSYNHDPAAVAAAEAAELLLNQRSISTTAAAAAPPAAAVYNDCLRTPTVNDIISDHTARGILEAFKPFFSDRNVKKVWHNYGFDRHVLEHLYTELEAAGSNLGQQQQLDNSAVLGAELNPSAQQQQQQQVDERAIAAELILGQQQPQPQHQQQQQGLAVEGDLNISQQQQQHSNQLQQQQLLPGVLQQQQLLLPSVSHHHQQQQQQGPDLTSPTTNQQSSACSSPDARKKRFKLQGFGGDTLHMARLWDASRKPGLGGGYGLEALSGDKKIVAKLTELKIEDAALSKRSMSDRFGLKRAKTDGSFVAKSQIPPMHVLHTDSFFRAEWIDYSALDAKATWNLHRALMAELQKQVAFMDEYLCQQLATGASDTQQAAGSSETYRQRMQRALKVVLDAKHHSQQQTAGANASRSPAGPAVISQNGNRPRPRPRKPGAVNGGPAASPTAARLQQQQQQTQPPGPGPVVAAAAAAVAQPAAVNGGAGSSSSSSSGSGQLASYTLWDLYCDYWQPFGEVLTDMEAEGVRVNRAHLAEQEQRAHEDMQAAEQHFRDWVTKYVPGAKYMNVNSGPQIRQLLFPDECPTRVKTFKALNPEYDLVPRPKNARRCIDFEIHGLWGRNVPGRLVKETNTKTGAAAVSGAVLWSLAGKPGAAAKALAELDAKQQQQQEAAAAAAAADNAADPTADPSSSSSDLSKVSIHRDTEDQSVHMIDLDDPDHTAADPDLDPIAGAAASSDDVALVPTAEIDPEELSALEQMGKQWKLGKMFAAMAVGKGERGIREGIEACLALEKLIEVSAIEKLLNAFIQPLQSDNISTTAEVSLPQLLQQQPEDNAEASATTDEPGTEDSTSAASSSSSEVGSDIGSTASSSSSSSLKLHRIHCSLNLNTETGRLSARRPNLQNQPALEKDRYKVRKAFCAEPGKTLVVADYGQLELRLLAHITNCKSMIRAFELGGDFHSRTALGMYDYIKDDIAAGGCLLEIGDWHGEGNPPPMLKDKYGSERRKAKILNFSIAYGKTAHGLTKDFGVSLEEAQATVDKWYSDRPEVLEWQEMTKKYARDRGWVNTMIGRRRGLERLGIKSKDKWEFLRASRAAINTPIQGSAADVASAAMLSIVNDKWLKDNGWKLLLQVHDEVMLEGPKETAEEAKRCVVAAMENPWKNLIGFEGKPLRVDLAVDANIADTWYDAK